MPRHAVFKYDCVSVTPWEWRTYRKFFNKSRFLNTAARKQPVVLFMCDGLCYSHKINEKCTLTSATPRFWNEAKFPFSAPVRNNLWCFKMVGEWLDMLSPHRSARCLSISGLVLVTYGHFITGNDVCLCWKQQSNVFAVEDSGNLTFKVFCKCISRKDRLISILLAPNRRLQRRKNVWGVSGLGLRDNVFQLYGRQRNLEV